MPLSHSPRPHKHRIPDVARDGEKPQPLKLANPEIIWQSPELTTGDEGCLSLPEHYAEVTRPDKIRLRYLDYQNEIREMDASGLLATCLQHEIDHLDGVLFVDHLSSLKRGMILRKLAKAKRSRSENGKPAGSMMWAANPRQAQSLRIVPVFWAMSGWKSAICMCRDRVAAGRKCLIKTSPATEFVHCTLPRG